MPTGRGKRVGARSLLSRASEQAGDGASVLFARLDAGHARRDSAAGTLARLAELVRAGAWSDEIAQLVAKAEALERDLDGEGD
ncbi:MAG TPA: hypothetical protein VJN88_10025 [Ktedonobacterales bacterium]|nr:hypothetical protein [Ktedonobacterales bacterium]